MEEMEAEYEITEAGGVGGRPRPIPASRTG